MKKISLGFLGVLVLLAVVGFLFRGPLFELIAERMTADMFVSQDTDAFDPGLSIGTRFPQIEARHQGAVIHDVGSFPIDKGMIFVANRSASW
ncbi:MAG: hypothetical protein ACR2PZ_07650 [Pseudomonadales bacterium]